MTKLIPEIRCGDCCIREDSRIIEGYAVVFNQWSIPQIVNVNTGSLTNPKIEVRIFREMILPNAIDGLVDTSDVTANFNHEEDKGILARSRNGVGSLSLIVDDFGFKYSFEAPGTTLGEDILQSMRRKDIDASSFAFFVNPKFDNWKKNVDGTFDRVIGKFLTIKDIAIVVRSAYKGAIASTRSIDAIEEIQINEDLEEYFKSLKKQYV